jgi:DNA polymerase-3 subunit delta'
MSVWQHVRGHGVLVELFRRSVRRGRLASAYLFVGPDGVGKKLFAKTLAQCLFCTRVPEEDLDACGECPACRQVLAGTHPDLLAVAPPEGKAVFPVELIAGSKERRGREGLCYDVSLRPMSADRRVAVVDEVHRMNAEAANAFLKTLEEPPPYATLILVTSNESALLPTIRSRCQPVRFAPLPTADVTELLVETGQLADRAEATAVAALSEGSLTVAAGLLDGELRGLRASLYDALADDADDPLALSRRMLDEGVEKAGDTAAQREAATWLVRFAIEFFRGTLAALAGADTLAPVPQVSRFAGRWDAGSATDWETVSALLERCAAAERQLARNNPPRMVLESLFADLCRSLRAARA